MSVVVTVRNEARNIAALVQSLLDQSHPPAELIVVDGVSNDGTLDILQGFADKGAIKLIAKACNIAEGRNIGIAASSEDWVAVTDAGCKVDPDWLKAFASAAGGVDPPDVLSGNFKFEVVTDFQQDVIYATYMGEREDSPTARFYPSSRSIAFRKSAWAAARGYPEWLYAAEDTLFNIRLRQLGYQFVFCPDAIVRWQPRENWAQVARQRYNYGRGNGRVGFGTRGYLTNVQIHLAILLPLLFIPLSVWALLPAAAAAALHVQRHLWKQARAGWVASGSFSRFLRILAIMEWVRLAGMAGFIRGRVERWQRPELVNRQREWMGVKSVEDLPPELV